MRLAIDVLLAEGYLAEEEGLRGAKLVRLVGLFREPEEDRPEQAERLLERHADIAHPDDEDSPF